MQRALNVWINSVMVGALREFNGLWAFAYSQEWLSREDAHPLCPGLPLQSEEHVDGASVRHEHARHPDLARYFAPRAKCHECAGQRQRHTCHEAEARVVGQMNTTQPRGLFGLCHLGSKKWGVHGL